ncbi:MAG: sigma-70 family RNA polymerase sigma factor [Christensenellaceae bacterium]|nr:sigma-70 family RNA polymerase sigma factor [Christensenellaceae bacterium]
MKTINLKEFYPEIYTADTFCEIPEEVLEELLSFRRKENAAKRKVYRNKAYYSLDRNDGVEHEALLFPQTPEEVYERKEDLVRLCDAVKMLTKKQRRRLYARTILDMSYAEIAKRENVSESSIRCSVCSARTFLKKFMN